MVKNFIEEIIDADLASGNVKNIVTRFPPEPNGYLHIGHAKSICLNFSLAKKYMGTCNLRYDDTNPVKEDMEYIRSIEADVSWLGFEWDKKLYASDYFEYMFDCALTLIKKGLAYVCELTPEQMREYRGTLTQPGMESPYRNRTVEENLDLFHRMRAGEFAEGEKVLRAKVDMASPNMNMRDPIIYRIIKATHHRTGDTWCIYPMYDFAHPLEDAYEGITHSVCTLEFEDHRPIYDWFVAHCGCEHTPHQYEFARLNLTRTIMSKRYLKQLVDEKVVDGWDDPRMPTISGLRRRGYTPESIRDFCERIGVAKANSEVDIALLEHCVREDLNAHATRVMAVIDPIKLTITNYPEGQTEQLTAVNNPNDEHSKTHEVTFSKHLYIERSDFMEVPVKKFFRLFVGGEVRLKYAYIIKCEGVVKDEDGNIVEILCTYDEKSKSGGENASRKVKGTLHWAEASTAVDVTVYEFDHLLNEGEGDFSQRINKDSIQTFQNAKAEPYINQSQPGDKFQFLRQGYYCRDSKETENLTFNKIVALKDSFKLPGENT